MKMDRKNIVIVVLFIALVISIGFISYSSFQSYRNQVFLSGYRYGYKQAITNSVSAIINDLQSKGYSAITYNNQTIPLCICQKK